MENHQNYKQMQEVQSELSLFLKRVRQRDQEHYRLFDYTSKLLAKRDDPQETSIHSAQISKSRDFFKQRLAMDISHQQKDFALAAKCQSFSFEEEDSLLTRRVAARILELTYNAIELRRQSNEYYSANYVKFKENCLKGLAQTKAKPAWIIRITNRYLTQKIQVQLERLRQTLNILEISDFQALAKIRTSYYSQLKRKEIQFAFAQKPQKPENTQVPHQNHKSVKKELNENPQKEVKKEILIRSKAKSTKDEQKQSIKMKKMEARKLKRLAASLSEVMDICRQDFLQQLAPQNKVWQTRRMLHQLVNRNKTNQNYINIFREKQWQFRQRIAKTPPFGAKGRANLNRCQSLQGQLIQKDEQQQRQPVSAFTTKEIRISEPILNKRQVINQPRYQKKEGNRLAPKSGHIKKNNIRQRSTFNTIQQNQKLKKQRQIFNSQKQILPQQDFVEITFKAAMPLPKARFPDINSRVVSLDKTQNMKKEDVLRTKLELKATGSNFFEQIEKRISKFCQMKRSLLI